MLRAPKSIFNSLGKIITKLRVEIGAVGVRAEYRLSFVGIPGSQTVQAAARSLGALNRGKRQGEQMPRYTKGGFRFPGGASQAMRA